MVSFVGQNLGGKQYLRIRRSIRYGILFGIVITLILSGLMLLGGESLLSMFNKNPEVIKWGLKRFWIALPFQWVCTIMEVESGALRGLGCSIGPTLIMIFGICIFRMVWLWTVFKAVPTFPVLVWSFPISWMIVCIASGFYLWYLLRRFPNENMER